MGLPPAEVAFGTSSFGNESDSGTARLLKWPLFLSDPNLQSTGRRLRLVVESLTEILLLNIETHALHQFLAFVSILLVACREVPYIGVLRARAYELDAGYFESSFLQDTDKFGCVRSLVVPGDLKESVRRLVHPDRCGWISRRLVLFSYDGLRLLRRGVAWAPFGHCLYHRLHFLGELILILQNLDRL